MTLADTARAVESGRTARFQARREAILASAVAVLNRRGLRGLTLAEVAARLGLAPTGVIYYFRDKEALASACLLDAIARHEAMIAQAMTAAGPRERLGAFIRAVFALRATEARGETRPIAGFTDVCALNAEPVNRAYARLFQRAGRLLDGQGGARVAAQHRNACAHLLLSELSWAAVWLDGFEPADYGRAAERAAAILTDGLAAPGASWPSPGPLDLTEPGDASSPTERFLGAAARLINAEGYHGASVERICAELNVSKGAFYHRYGSKDELALAGFRRRFDTIWRAIRAAEAGGGSALEVLMALSAALAARQLEGAAPLLRASARTTLPETLRAGLAAPSERLSLRLASILSDGIADGSIRPLDVNVGAQLIIGLIDAAADLRPWAPDLAADDLVRPLFQGLAAPA